MRFLPELHDRAACATSAPTPTCRPATSAWAAARSASCSGSTSGSATSSPACLTGKGLNWGGSLIRPEATGYGTVYFAAGDAQDPRRLRSRARPSTISGSGNVAQYAVEKVNHLGGKVVTLSDSNGTIYDPDGIDAEKLAYVMDLKNVKRGRISEYAKKYKCEYLDGKRPWGVKCDIALPCATQNEVDESDAKTLVKNGCICVSEGANMPTDAGRDRGLPRSAKILYGPGKAANAGGVATSGLEMSQNSLRLCWTREEVDQRLHGIMKTIHEHCVKYGNGRTSSSTTSTAPTSPASSRSPTRCSIRASCNRPLFARRVRRGRPGVRSGSKGPAARDARALPHGRALFFASSEEFSGRFAAR